RTTESASYQPPARHRKRRAVADHEVVEQAYVDQRQRLLEAGGDGAVGGAGLGVAAGMVVADDHRRRTLRQRAFDQDPRMHLGAVDAAAEQLLEAERAMAGVEVERGEHFMSQSAQALGEIAAGRGRVAERLAALEVAGQD